MSFPEQPEPLVSTVDVVFQRERRLKLVHCRPPRARLFLTDSILQRFVICCALALLGCVSSCSIGVSCVCSLCRVLCTFRMKTQRFPKIGACWRMANLLVGCAVEENES